MNKADELTAFLSANQVLLVLDNFEHVQPAAAPVVDPLTACLHLRILVTSRDHYTCVPSVTLLSQCWQRPFACVAHF